jgi:hypothetical protein
LTYNVLRKWFGEIKMSKIEQLHPDVTRELIDDDTIVVITSKGTTRSMVDAWGATIVEAIKNWPSDEPYLAIYDVSQSGITPYSRSKSEQIAREAASIEREHPMLAFALVVDRSVVGHLIRLFSKRSIQRAYPEWHTDIFHSRDEALGWLRHLRDETISEPTDTKNTNL